MHVYVVVFEEISMTEETHLFALISCRIELLVYAAIVILIEDKAFFNNFDLESA